MTAEDFRNVLVAHWRLIATCALCAMIATAIGSLLFTPSTVSYDSSAVVQVDTGATTVDATFIGTEVWLTKSNTVLSSVASQNAGVTLAQLKGEVSASAITGTRLVNITVSDPDATRAATLANEVADALVAAQQDQDQRDSSVLTPRQQQIHDEITATQGQIDQLTAQLSKLQTTVQDPHTADLLNQLDALRSKSNALELLLSQTQTPTQITIRVVDRAQVSPGRSRSALTSTVLYGGTGAILGAVLGIGLAILRSRTRGSSGHENLNGHARTADVAMKGERVPVSSTEQ